MRTTTSNGTKFLPFHTVEWLSMLKPDSTDGRREDTGRGVRKLQTRWSRLELGKMRGWQRSAGVWGGADGDLQWLW